jgi:hypothetical protein
MNIPQSGGGSGLRTVIQLLTRWDDDHLHHFRIHGRDYGIAYIGGPNFGEDAAVVPLSQFGFRPLGKQRLNVRQKPAVLQRRGRGQHYRLRLGGLARRRERGEQTHNAD